MNGIINTYKLLQNNKNYKILIDILRLFLKYPKSFIKQINSENYKTFLRAINNENPINILKNIQNLLLNTSKDDFAKTVAKINSFSESLKKLDIKGKHIVLCVSHEASRTGAPLIILKISNYLKTRYIPIQILCKGGEIKKEFTNNSPTYVLQFYHNKYLLNKEMKYLMQKINAVGKIEKSYVNSEGSTKILMHLNKYTNSTIISLIHEMGNYYPKNSWNHISKYSNHIVFPANEVKNLALDNSNFEAEKINIIGQGLLKEELLYLPFDKSRDLIRKELKLGENSFIILACGTPIPRKGIDLFISTSIAVLNSLKQNQKTNVHFVWLGSTNQNEHQVWARRDIKQSNNTTNIHLIGSRSNTIPYFLGSDLFLMTSRGDPYPCVVHEAKAAGLPIIAFSNSGGIPEMLDKYDFLVDYCDVSKMSNTIISILNTQSTDTNKEKIRRKAAVSLSFKKYVNKLDTLT